MQFSRLPLAALLSAGLLALAACGGSSSVSEVVEPPTVVEPPAPPPPVALDIDGNEGLSAGETTIPAGGMITRGNVTFNCPASAGDAGCSVTVTDSLGTLTAEATGGATADVAPAPEPVPEPVPVPVALNIDGGEGLSAGETTIPAGGMITRGNVTFTCPAGAGDAGCTVTVTDSLGTLTASATGGATADVAPAPEPVPEPEPVPVPQALAGVDVQLADVGLSLSW